ncbi:MAG: hypothetical protein ACUVXH_04075 [Anaerolineae bacterium]
MVDWVGLAFHALWVLGLAVLLTVGSLASWEARRSGRRLAAVLGRPGHVAASSAGLALLALGLACTAGPIWERALGGILTAAWVAQGAWVLRRRARGSRDG